jgi:hypothetical protein
MLQLSQTAMGEAPLSIALLPERSQLTTSQTRTVVQAQECALAIADVRALMLDHDKRGYRAVWRGEPSR